MRLIDADAYAAEMKKRQDACMDVMANAHSDRMYTENEHWAGVLAAFAEAKITLDKMPTVSGWVSVKDRLPDEDGSTLICTKNGKVCTARFYKRQGGWNAYAGRNAAYWKPLPEPPKEDDA